MVHNNLSILLISETKTDSSLPTAQFQIESHKTYRLDRNFNEGSINFDMSIERFYTEI